VGYFVTTSACKIRVSADSFRSACQHLLSTGFLTEWAHMSGSQFNGEQVVSRFYAWVDMQELAACVNNGDLVGVFECFSFTVDVDDGGNIVCLHYDSRMGDEQHLLRRLAPFFGADNYIAWRGEDAEFWVSCFRE
jgi:hypothetical protein